jgi:hypothetical protein
MDMDRTSKLRAVALTLALVAAAAGTGWALQVPLTALAEVGAAELPPASTPADVPLPGLSVLAWPQPEAQADGDEGASAGVPNEGVEEIVGLEEMSVTGEASPQR